MNPLDPPHAIVMLVGAIEFWWDRPEDPDRFNSPAAIEYRHHRNMINELLVNAGYLVYRPHEAFKGSWDLRAQPINDWVVDCADILVNMSPPGTEGEGTKGEVKRAREQGKPVINCPPGTDLGVFMYELRNRADRFLTQSRKPATLEL